MKILVTLLLIVCFGIAGQFPEIPEENPYPAQTQEDEELVGIATKAVKWFNNVDLSHIETDKISDHLPYIKKNKACMKDSYCYTQDVRFIQETALIQKKYGKIKRAKYVMVLPTNSENERKVGAYVDISQKSNTFDWVYVDVTFQLKDGDIYLMNFTADEVTKEEPKLEAVSLEDQEKMESEKLTAKDEK